MVFFACQMQILIMSGNAIKRQILVTWCQNKCLKAHPFLIFTARVLHSLSDVSPSRLFCWQERKGGKERRFCQAAITIIDVKWTTDTMGQPV